MFARRFWVSFLVFVLTGCTAPRGQVEYYERIVAQHPERYPVRVELADACLARARETHDPRWLAKARSQVQKSLETQPTYEAYLTMARIENYAHRFESALKWADRAATASLYVGNDPAVTAILVEAHLGLGEDEQARRALDSRPTAKPDFYTAAATAQLHHAAQQHEAAAAAFLEAASLARQAKVDELVAWAEASAAGAFLDAHQPELARPHLETATRLAPQLQLNRIHWAEYYEAVNEPAQALRVYESLLARTSDPVVHHRAYRLAKRLGQDNVARRHFTAAEKGFLAPIEAGEVYTLGSLAQLYAEAGVQLDRARQLAEDNLKYKRDREARDTLAAVQRAVTNTSLPTPPRGTRAGSSQTQSPAPRPVSAN